MMWRRGIILALAALILGAAGACAGDDAFRPTPAPAWESAPEAAADASLAPAPAQAPTSPPQAVPTAAPPAREPRGGGNLQAAPLPQSRIVVHNASMVLVVDDVARTVDRIAGVARSLGGWVVDSDRSSRHNGTIAIRVPAQALDEAFLQVEALALAVESRAVTSEDVTDDYVDSQSRLAGLRATEERLLSFLDRAERVEEALRVQQEISDLQRQIEEIQGRLNFLEQTSAYSLIDVSLKVSAQVISVNAGPDASVRVGQVARFRASFIPPSGIDEFSFTWDFGDGASVTGSGSVVRPDGRRVTATVNHTYADDHDSPYIVTIRLTGDGAGGIGEGSDSLEVAVSHVPTIEVFAGEDRTAEEGDDVDYSASFTRPGELWDYQYQWDFGDGSPTATGKPAEGATRVEATHSFSDHRPTAYAAVVTVSAMSDAGLVSGSGSFDVQVTESEGFLIGNWDAGATAKAAVRALSAVARVLTTVGIWLGIFSPVILVLAGIIYFGNRRGLWARLFGRPGSPWPGQGSQTGGPPASPG